MSKETKFTLLIYGLAVLSGLTVFALGEFMLKWVFK